MLLIMVVQSTHHWWIMAAFTLNQRYIAENICINRFDLIPTCLGACFLQEQLTRKEEQQKALPEIKVQEIVLFAAFHPAVLQVPVVHQASPNHPRPQPPMLPADYGAAVFRPPIVVS